MIHRRQRTDDRRSISPLVFLLKTNRGDAQRVEFILLTALGAEDRKKKIEIKY